MTFALLCCLALAIVPALPLALSVLLSFTNIQFRSLGFFSVAGLSYRNDHVAIMIDMIKVRRRKRPTISTASLTGHVSAAVEANTAWFTLSFVRVHIQLLENAGGSTNNNNKAATELSALAPTVLGRSAMWRRLTTQALKWLSSLPIQLLLVALAKYVVTDIEVITVETPSSSLLATMDHLHFSSTLFTTNTHGTTLCPHSLKRAEHLFWRSKVFEITVLAGAMHVAYQGQSVLRLPQCQQAVVRCHVGTSCVTLTHVETDLWLGCMSAVLPSQPWAARVSSIVMSARRRCESAKRTVYEFSLALNQLDCTVWDIPLFSLAHGKVDMSTSHVLRLVTPLTSESRWIQAIVRLDNPELRLDLDTLSRLSTPPATSTSSTTTTTTTSSSSKRSAKGRADQQPDTLWPLPQMTLSLILEMPKVCLAADKQATRFVGWQSRHMQLGLAGDFVSQDGVHSTLSDTSKTTHRQRHFPRRWTELIRRPRKSSSLSSTKSTLLYSIETQVILDAMTLDIQPSQYDSLLTIQKLSYTACIRTTTKTSHVFQWNPSQYEYMESNLAVEAPVVGTVETNRFEEINFLIHLLCPPKDPESPSTPPTPTHPSDLSWIKRTSLHLTVRHASIIVIGFDQGLRDQREPPPRHIDNAPKQDTLAKMTCHLDRMALDFSGDRHEQHTAAAESINVDLASDTKGGTANLGLLRFSFHRLSVRKAIYCKGSAVPHPTLVAWISQCYVHHQIQVCGRSLFANVACSIHLLRLDYSLDTHYAALLWSHTLHKLRSRFFTAQRPPSSSPSLITMTTLKVECRQLDAFVTLSDKTRVVLRVTDGDFYRVGAQPRCTAASWALLGTSVRHPGQWEALLDLDAISISFCPSNSGMRTLVQVDTFALCIPYQYVLSHVVDDGICLFKAVKDLQDRCADPEHHFTLVGPTSRPTPIPVPDIRFQCNTLTITLDDDPFESKLRRIFYQGKKEQHRRLETLAAFESRVSSLFMTQKNFDDSMRTESSDSVATTLSAPPTGRQSDTGDTHIIEAKNKLDMHHATSWIKRIGQAIQEEQLLYGDTTLQSDTTPTLVAAAEVDNAVDADANEDADDTPDVTRNTTLSLDTEDDNESAYTIVMAPHPQYPPLAKVHVCHPTFRFQSLDFDQAQCLDFIHKLGKGLPSDIVFSFILPLRLSIHAGETWIDIRDYPVPFLYVPRDESENNKVWSLVGDYCLGDEIGNHFGSRCIPIRIGQCYDLNAVRTTSPLKFYSTVDYHIHTHSMTSVCWSVSYQPAIQDVMAVIDTMTPTAVDPSPKLSFWDKVRFLIHTRTCLTFEHGDFALVLKGTHDPYQLTDKGAGVVKIWRNNVVWKFGHDNPQNEFVQVRCQDYAFGTPDLVHGGFQRLGKAPEPTPMPTLDYRFAKRCIKLSGGIQMGIRCYLERVCGPSCPTCSGQSKCHFSTFYPHYNVLYRSPQHCALNHDAFAGFRSQFIHLSISITKESDGETGQDKMSAMCISPQFADHFFQWFQLYNDNMGLLMRRGPLFRPGDTRIEKYKFGACTRTIKYKISVHPFKVSYFYMDSDEWLVSKQLEHLGVRAAISNFIVDIHQRRSVIQGWDEHLQQDRIRTSWSVHEMEIQLLDADFRVIRAQTRPHTNSITPCEAHSWIDTDDLVDIECPDRAPRMLVQADVIPFAYTPCTYYLKQLDQEHSHSDHHLRQTHDCIMGSAMETHEMQMILLENQIQWVDTEIRNQDRRLMYLENELLKHANDTNLFAEVTDVKETRAFLVNKRDQLQRCLKDMRRRSLPSLPSIMSHEEASTVADESPTEPTSSTNAEDMGRKSPSPLSHWESIMGTFQQRCIVHNPQIIWNMPLQEAFGYWRGQRSYHSVRNFNLSNRAVQFLREMMDMSNPPSQPRPSTEVETEASMDHDMAQALIEKLLAESDQDALDETSGPDGEEGKPANAGWNVNDPTYQRKTIPDGYVMRSETLIDLLNPQVQFQASRADDFAIIVAGERMQVKMFMISDNLDADLTDPTHLVKKRTVVSTENAQAFVTQRLPERFDHLHIDNQYGNRGNEAWPLWIPTGMLMNERYFKESPRLKRIVNHLTGTIQHDRHNPLRIKIKAPISDFEPFEDRCDTVHVHFPKMTLALNSAQYEVIYDILSKLVLKNEQPASQQRLGSHLHNIMLTADHSNLSNMIDHVIRLQAQVRKLRRIELEFRNNGTQDDELTHIQYELKDSSEHLYLMMEAIKLFRTRCLPKTERNLHAIQPSMKFDLTAQHLEWEMLTAENQPFSHWRFDHLHYRIVTTRDGTYSHTIEVDTVHAQHTSPSPVFGEVLAPFIDTRNQRTPDFSRQKMVRVYYVTVPPVGGIKVVQHLEINLFPLKIQLTYEFGRALMAYVFPPVDSNTSGSGNHDSHPSQDRLGVDNRVAMSRSSSADMSLMLEGLVVADPSPSRTMDGDSASENDGIWFGLKKPTEDDGRQTTDSGGSATKGQANQSTGYGTVRKVVVPTEWFRDGLWRKRKPSESNQVDEIAVMKTRASSRRTFIRIKVPGAQHCLTFLGPSDRRLYDVRNFHLRQPNLEYRNKTWSWEELLSELHLRRTVLRHSPALLREKLGIRRRQSAPDLKERSTLRRANDDPGDEIQSIAMVSTLSTATSTAWPYRSDTSSGLSDSDRLWDNDDDEEDEEEEDSMSLHSASSHISELIPAAATSTRRALLPKGAQLLLRMVRSRFAGQDMANSSRFDQVSMSSQPSVNQTSASLSSSASSSQQGRQRSISNGHVPLDEGETDALRTRGKLLLGKMYTGPLSPHRATHADSSL